MSGIKLSPAKELISLDVTEWPDSAKRKVREAIEKIRADVETSLNDVLEPTGWSKDLLGEVFVMLAAEGAEVQLDVVRRAHTNGGEVTRAEVYEIGGYPDGRSLRGFTRPCNRVTQKLREKGLLPEDAPELLEPLYSPAAKGYSQALGFRIPPELVNAS